MWVGNRNHGFLLLKTRLRSQMRMFSRCLFHDHVLGNQFHTKPIKYYIYDLYLHLQLFVNRNYNLLPILYVLL